MTHEKSRPGIPPITRSLRAGVAALITLIMSASLSRAAEPSIVVRHGAQYGEPVTPRVLWTDLRQIPKPRPWRPGDPIREVPRRHYQRLAIQPQPEPRLDPLLAVQALLGAQRRQQAAFGVPALNFNGQGFTGANPPDTVGDVGALYYIQAVNDFGGTLYTVYSKADGSVVAGPFTLHDLGGIGNCADGAGDPIVLYDPLANRWLLSEFASAGSTLCVYISQTADPIAGGWYNYQFDTPTFPDYPKYGVWPDAYYVAANEDSVGGLYALDRANMLTGAAAGFQRFTVSDLAGFSFQALIPCDLDGPAPPSGAPNYFMRHRDDEAHNSGSNDATKDFIEVYSFHVDWGDPGQSSLTGPQTIDVTEFDSTLCGLTSFSCFPQPGSQTELDPLREVVMHRLQYRNFGSHETLVGCFVTDVDGTDHGGIRWFELRKSGGATWLLNQEGTFAPDSHHRWMASISMDGSGNIAMGYNVSSSTLAPSLRYVGRLSTDPPGTMPQGEHVIVNGTAANSSNRYGDYSAMCVDPSDDCTFWFTGEYNPASSWSTRIASFGFDTCGCVKPPGPTGISAVPNGSNQIDVAWNPVNDATNYIVSRATGACPQASYQLLSDGVASTNFSDTTVSGGLTYSYVVSALISNVTCESSNSACAAAAATGDCLLPPAFAGLVDVSSADNSICALRLSWNEATSPCGGPVAYNLYRNSAPVFEPGPSNLLASCLSTTQYIDKAVVEGTTYYYVVRAEDLQGVGNGACSSGSADTNRVTRNGSPVGPNMLVSGDDMESGLAANWMSVSLPADSGTAGWIAVNDESHSPTTSLFCADEGSVKDQALELKQLLDVPSNGVTRLTFWHRVKTEPEYDGGVLEYSTDNGTNWHDILEGDGAGVAANPARLLSGGYNATLDSCCDNPLPGRDAWSGDLGNDFTQVTVNLDDMGGESIRLRWRMGCDDTVAADGWWIDDLAIFSTTCCQPSGYGTWSNFFAWVTSGGAPKQDENADGISNFKSYFFGFSPTGGPPASPGSRLPRIIQEPGGNRYTFVINTAAVMAAEYSILTATNLRDGPWILLEPLPQPDSNGVVWTLIPDSEDRIFLQLQIFE